MMNMIMFNFVYEHRFIRIAKKELFDHLYSYAATQGVAIRA